MGMYLETDSQGRVLGPRSKADQLVADGARELPGPPTTYEPFLVCVVENKHFHAAGFIYSGEELADFLVPDPRPKRWLVAEAAVRQNFQPATIAEHLADVEDYRKGYKQLTIAQRRMTREEVEDYARKMMGPDVQVFHLEDE